MVLELEDNLRKDAFYITSWASAGFSTLSDRKFHVQASRLTMSTSKSIYKLCQWSVFASSSACLTLARLTWFTSAPSRTVYLLFLRLPQIIIYVCSSFNHALAHLLRHLGSTFCGAAPVRGNIRPWPAQNKLAETCPAMVWREILTSSSVARYSLLYWADWMLVYSSSSRERTYTSAQFAASSWSGCLIYSITRARPPGSLASCPLSYRFDGGCRENISF